MNIYFISRNYKSVFDAAGKAKTDCEFVLQKMGFKNLGFKQSAIPNSVLGTLKNFLGITLALLRLPFKATLCTQYPNSKFRGYILFVAKLKRCKIITIVHDVRALKGKTKDTYKEISQIVTDVIIVHNSSMKAWFIEQGVKVPVVVLEIFDYIADRRPEQNDMTPSEPHYEITYAGGLGHKKNAYIYDVDMLSATKYKLKLYGRGFEPESVKVKNEDSIIDYQGAFPSNEIAYKIVGDFGLVWDGDSTHTCTGQYGAYLKFNNPHKTSLYLLCGLPVIIWKEAALAPFIINNRLGIGVSDLKDLDRTLANLTHADYTAIKDNVRNYQNKVMSGYFFETAINKAIQKL